MKNYKANIIVLGETGNGKSSFCNCVLKKNKFSVSDDTKSETKETIGYYDDNNNIFMIDTPGLQDSEGTDKQHLVQLIDYVKKQTHLQAVLIIFNFHQPRFPQNIKTMIKLLCNAFPQTDFWNHVGLVFTRFFDYMPESHKQKKANFSEKYNKEIEKLIKETGGFIIPNNFRCPTFFVDSPEEENEMDSNTKEEINRLIAWAANLQPLDVSQCKKVDPNIKNEIEEYDERVLDSYEDAANLQKVIKIGKFKRKKLIDYDNKEHFTDWEQYDEYNKYEKIKDEIVGVLDQQNIETEIIENKRRVVDLENTGFFGRVFNNFKYKDEIIKTPSYKISSKKTAIYKSGKKETI